MAQRPLGGAVTFMDMVGGAMAFLKLKAKYDQYTQVSWNEEGRIALTSPSVDEVHREEMTLALDTRIPSPPRRAKKKKTCCVCCGFDCSLFWKAIALVFGLYTLYYLFRAFKWAVTPPLSGLEGMPEFNVSLGCHVDAPYIYNDGEVMKLIAVEGSNAEHRLVVNGANVSTITVLENHPDATEVEYRINIRSSQKEALEYVNIDTYGTNSLTIGTNPIQPLPYCMRFDVKMYVPPNVKRLWIKSTPDTHLSFGAGTQIAGIDHLEIFLAGSSANNIIRPIPDILAKKVTLKAAGGWIVGEATAVNQFQVSSEHGNVTINLNITHAAPSDPANPEKVSVESITGPGRTDITVTGSKASKRKIEDMHTSVGAGDMYLTYKDAEYNGKIMMYSKSYAVTGSASKFKVPQEHHKGAEEHIPRWTHFAGNPDGGDELFITSREGYSRLYF